MRFCKAKLLELGETLQCDFCPLEVTQMHVDVKKQEITCYGCDTPVMLYDPQTLPLIIDDLKANGFIASKAHQEPTEEGKP